MSTLLSRVAAVVTIVFTLVISLTSWLAMGLPSSASFITQNPCPLPCIYGIIPGEIDYEQTRVIVEQTAGSEYSDSPVNGGSLIFRIEQDAFSVLGMATLNLPDDTLVRAVGVLPVEEDDLGRLGDLVDSGLQPTRVYRSCDTASPLLLVAFGADSRVIAELALPPHLRPDTPITFMRVYMDEGDTLTESVVSFGCAVETGWLGFAPRWTYLAAS
jgi:hypothetical protein